LAFVCFAVLASISSSSLDMVLPKTLTASSN
jgi:hypothetical protein